MLSFINDQFSDFGALGPKWPQSSEDG